VHQTRKKEHHSRPRRYLTNANIVLMLILFVYSIGKIYYCCGELKEDSSLDVLVSQLICLRLLWCAAHRCCYWCYVCWLNIICSRRMITRSLLNNATLEKTSHLQWRPCLLSIVISRTVSFLRKHFHEQLFFGGMGSGGGDQISNCEIVFLLLAITWLIPTNSWWELLCDGNK